MEWSLKAHPLFERDIKKLSKIDKDRLSGLILRIKENPDRFKLLTGCHRCFRVRFGNFRLVYALKSKTIWLIIVENRKKVYKEL
ncbi:Uncharacterised protein [uncultured archaeon]|nr:Uncharacterised protein [uncultured archaeon]